MSAVDDLFAQLRREGRKAFIPFVTAGDPDLEFTAQVIRELVQRGCSLCELGIPYSDPIADGPVIQASYTRALKHQIKVPQIFDCVQRQLADIAAPLVSMVSYAIVYRHGLEKFVTQAREAGFAGAIIPDLPVDESAPLLEICRRHDFSLVQLITPTTPRPRALQIAQTSSGFIYYVSVTGITGERTEIPPQVLDQVGWLREQTELPICIGFGISQPEHVTRLAPVADGVIVGSAFVRRMAQVDERGREAVLRDIGGFADTLLAALHSA